MADLLIDTDVIIDYLRGQTDAVSFLDGTSEHLLLSVVTVAELYSGVREGKERTALESFLQAFELVPLTPEISAQGGLIRRDFGPSHNVGLADALIAATAESRGATVVTLNSKPFPSLSAVFVPYVTS